MRWATRIPVREVAAAVLAGTLSGAGPAAAKDLDSGGPLEAPGPFEGPGLVLGAFAGLDDVHDVAAGGGGAVGVRLHAAVALGVHGAALFGPPASTDSPDEPNPLLSWHLLGWVRFTAAEVPRFRLDLDVFAGMARRATGTVFVTVDGETVDVLPDFRFEPRAMWRSDLGRSRVGLQARVEAIPLFRRRVGHYDGGRTTEEVLGSLVLAEVMAGPRIERHQPSGGWHGFSFMVGVAYSGLEEQVVPFPALHVSYVTGFDPARPGRVR